MTVEHFIRLFREALPGIASEVADSAGQWAVKGFIDTHRKIYTISTDTKVTSKIIELYLFPRLLAFANEHHLTIEPASEQNYYPDLTFRDADGNLFAVDVKSSYRKTATTINGFTLGAFTGYFRDRSQTKNCMYPYGAYKAHLVLGILYTANPVVDEQRVYALSELERIPSVLKDFHFFIQEKWRIASDCPGSGNTKNIGSIKDIDDLIHGRGPFAPLGEAVFDDYWVHYLTKDMARAAELVQPYYKNLEDYRRFRGMHD